MTIEATSSGRLADQVAIVTGAGTGIGRASAIALALEGASIVLVGRRRHLLERCAEEIHDVSRSATLIQSVDVSDERSVEAAVLAAVARFGRIDLLLNNAAINLPRRRFLETRLEDWRQITDVNLQGAFLCIRAVLPTMRQQRSGLIINVASGAALHGSFGAGAAYCASKRGVVALTQVLNSEGWEDGIRATTLYPGDVDTDILNQRPRPPSPEERASMLQPEDIAAAVVFIATLPSRAIVEDLIIRPRVRRQTAGGAR